MLGEFPEGSDVSIGMECFGAPSLLAGLAYGNGAPGSVNIHSARLFFGGTLKLHENTSLASSIEVLTNLNKENVAN